MKKGVIIGIVLGILIIAAVIGVYFYLNSSPQPTQLIGDETLEVKVTMDNGTPLPRLEVDLWQVGSKGPPDAGISYTNDESIAQFKIPDGEYEIGFNSANFPGNLVYPERTYVLVEKGVPASKTILIKAKQEE